MARYDVERYLNVRSAGGASFGPSGDRLAFLLDTTGVDQVWTLAAPGAWPEQRTFEDDQVDFVDWSPTRREFAFGMDEGGNERMQLYRLDATDGTVTDLTGRPEAKHRWGGWTGDGDRFSFASNRRETAVFDVYVQDRDGDDAERVLEGDGWLEVGDWGPDDERLLVWEVHWSFDQDLYVLDVATGEREHVTPHEGDVRYVAAEWGPDGESLYVVTDEGSDTTFLARIDLATGDLETVADGGDWNVDGLAVHAETGRVAYTRNVDGYSEVVVGELDGPAAVERLPEPDLPDGVVEDFEFDPDGDRLAVTVGAADENENVHVVDVASGETEQWTRAPTAGIPRETFRAPDLVRYESFDGLSVPAYFTLPEDAPEGETPVVVDIHGGPEAQRRPRFSPLGQYLLERGYAVFEPNVRGSTGYGREYTHLDDVENRMDSVADVKAGVEWLADRPAVDPDRIVAFGGSYGGFMVLASLSEYPDLWAAGVDAVGIANFVTFLENTGDWRRELREAEYGSLADDRAFLESVSPINNVDAIDAPLFVLHGANDPRVPVGEAEQIVAELRERSVPVRKLIFEDEGHGFSKLDNRVEAYTAVAEFLDEHV